MVFSAESLVFVVYLLFMLGVGVFFFLKNKKPDAKTKGKTNLDDYDYGVDDEDEYADFETYQEEGEDA